MHTAEDESDPQSEDAENNSPQSHNGPKNNPNAARERGKAKVPSGGQGSIHPRDGADIKQPGKDD